MRVIKIHVQLHRPPVSRRRASARIAIGRRPASDVGPCRAVASRVGPRRRRASGPDPCPKGVIPRTLRTSLHIMALISPPAPSNPPVPYEELSQRGRKERGRSPVLEYSSPPAP
eukprot:4796663-Prymnesium_polylepis.1